MCSSTDHGRITTLLFLQHTISVPIEDWRIRLLDFLERGRLPDNPAMKVEVKRRATKSVIYRRLLDAILLRCIANHELYETMSEVHSRVNWNTKLYMQLKQLGYYWPAMIHDCMDIVKIC